MKVLVALGMEALLQIEEPEWTTKETIENDSTYGLVGMPPLPSVMV
jgi:hypothetical protein